MTLNVSCDVHALPCPTRKLQGVFDVFYLDPKKTKKPASAVLFVWRVCFISTVMLTCMRTTITYQTGTNSLILMARLTMLENLCCPTPKSWIERQTGMVAINRYVSSSSYDYSSPSCVMLQEKGHSAWQWNECFLREC